MLRRMMSERAFWRFLALSVRLPFAFGMPLWRALWLAAWGGQRLIRARYLGI